MSNFDVRIVIVMICRVFFLNIVWWLKCIFFKLNEISDCLYIFIGFRVCYCYLFWVLVLNVLVWMILVIGVMFKLILFDFWWEFVLFLVFYIWIECRFWIIKEKFMEDYFKLFFIGDLENGWFVGCIDVWRLSVLE